MSTVVELSPHDKKEIFEFNKVAKQADGAIWYQEDDTVILAAVAVDSTPVDEDFLPLTVQYIEKTYASGKFPGGFIKRESKPSDFETLTSRIIDRSIRPLFPKGFSYPVVLTVTVLSCDENADLQRVALNAASAAIYTSPLPIDRMVCGVRIGKVIDEENGDKFIVNPTYSQLQESSLDLFVSGNKEDLLMIEMKTNSSENFEFINPSIIDAIEPSSLQAIPNQLMNELAESEIIKALKFAGDAINSATRLYEDNFKEVCKPKKEYILKAEIENKEVYDFIKLNYIDDIKTAINHMAKSERSEELANIKNRVLETKEAKDNEWEDEVVSVMLGKIKKELVRAQILDDRVRADGRALDEVRPISIETNILPKAHSSVLFTRGQTQALCVLTLGTDQDRQSYELLNSRTSNYENLMIHYNFPGYSVGEAKRQGPPGRRELGHGNLAKRAIESSIPLDNDQTIRIVSEVLESNGSSSMATVCASSLALKAANIPTIKLVAGVAMGLIVEDDNYAVLTDIMGLEDHDGDMDFKVTGSKDGVTALQMDIKLGGVNYEILENALAQAREARLHILNLMQKAEEDIVINKKSLPALIDFKVETDKIVDIIGKAGATIREIIEKFEVSIDLDRDSGGVKVQGHDHSKVEDAVLFIKNIVSNAIGRRPRQNRENKKAEYSKGDILDGVVEKIIKVGALVKLPDGNVGMIHISKLANSRVENVEDIVKDGENIKVIFIEQKRDGKISLAMDGVKLN